MKGKTVVQGSLITTLDHLYRCEFVLVRDKPYHQGWVRSWTMRTAALYVESGRVYEGVKITPKETKEEAK